MDLGFHSETTCTYYTVVSKKLDNNVGCAYIAVAESQIVEESQFQHTDGVEVLAAEVHQIKEAITDVHLQGLGELDIY